MYCFSCSFSIFSLSWEEGQSRDGSGGPLLAPFHINHGIFLHSCALCFSRRMILLKEMKQITYLLLRGRAGGGVAMLSISNSEMEGLLLSFWEKQAQWSVGCGNSNENAGRYGLSTWSGLGIQSSVKLNLRFDSFKNESKSSPMNDSMKEYIHLKVPVQRAR